MLPHYNFIVLSALTKSSHEVRLGKDGRVTKLQQKESIIFVSLLTLSRLFDVI